ncbi:MAG: YggS family pyridoxal phosphate-dependent enzyme, partial [Thermoguttaceae bacterium]|nr:YggS family pyridoxal phosphate-dependent enzyme [Thermoguttaceae bacterium]
MSNTPAEVAARVARVRETIAETARRCGRRPEEITLIAVTKYAAPDEGFVEALAEAGCFDLAENRPQKLREKIDAVRDQRIRWHLIGTLQKNKVKMVVGRAALIHSVDSLALAEEIARLAPPAGVDALV